MSTAAASAGFPSAPSERQMDRLVSVVAPLARVTQPRVWGVERIPERGALFVGNHTIFGFLDLPFMMSELWTRRGIAVRASCGVVMRHGWQSCASCPPGQRCSATTWGHLTALT